MEVKVGVEVQVEVEAVVVLLLLEAAVGVVPLASRRIARDCEIAERIGE